MRCSISPIICLSKMRFKWSKHIMQCIPMMIERWTNKCSSKAWWSYLYIEHDFSENDVWIISFRPVSVHLVILLTILKLFLCLSDKNQ